GRRAEGGFEGREVIEEKSPPRQSLFATRYSLLLHDHRRAHPHALVEVDDIVIGEPEAARRHRLPDRLGLVRAVDAVERGAEIERARAERIVRTARHMAREVGPAPQHLRGRRPGRPFALGADALDAAPAEAVAPDADAVAQRLTIAQHEIKPSFPRPD